MRARYLVAGTLALAITACQSDSTEPVVVVTPDAAIGTYDKQPTGAQTRSANCGSEVVVDGLIRLYPDANWVKIDIGSTPSGSSVCAFVGGKWSRINSTTIELTPDQSAFPGFGAQQATVVGDDLTFPATNGALYKRRS